MPPKKNPVAARIKKIMQADDEVGKIAQATPVLVCAFPRTTLFHGHAPNVSHAESNLTRPTSSLNAVKALEMFMGELIKSTSDIALARGAKMISAGHLKACITSNEKFDFLVEIVQGVPDLPAADEAKPAGKKSAKRERAEPSPAVAGSLDDDDYGMPAPPPMKVMRSKPAEVPGTEAPNVGSLGGDDLDLPVAAAPAVGTLTGTLGGLDDDYDDL